MPGRKRFKGSRVRPAVYIHVGAPKTGTTFLQRVLWRGSRTMARDGVLYPAEPTGDHFRAAQDLRGVRFRDYDDPAVPGSWRRVVDLAQEWRGSAVVISHEQLAWASEDEARAAIESLRPAEVHVVYTARDLGRQLPAMWQEDIKNGGVTGFVDFLRAVQTQDSDPYGRMFWGSQDAVAVLDRWGAAVPPERVYVVTVPPPGAPQDLLWRRFAGLLGLDPDCCDIDVERSNVSLSRTDVELLRGINLSLKGKLRWPEYEALVKHWFAETVLTAQPKAGSISLPRSWHAWTIERSQRLVAGLRDAGYAVVGDLEELMPSPPVVDGLPSEGGFADGQVDATVDGIVDLLERVARTPKEDWPQPRRVQDLNEELARRRRQPFKTYVRDMSEQYQAVMRARVAWWHGVERVRRLSPRLDRRTG